MVQRMVGPKAITATQLGKEAGVPQPTLSKWLREAQAAAMTTTTAPERPTPSVRARTAEDKMRLVMAVESLGPEERGAFLRREGLHDGELQVWRAAMVQALDPRRAPSSTPRPVDHKRIKELERELGRKDRALAETAALLVLAKKAESLWGDGDDGTGGRSEK
jgi:hypothetical protein